MKKSVLLLKLSLLIVFIVLSWLLLDSVLILYDKVSLLLIGAGIFGPLIYMLLMMLSVLIVPLPSSPLAVVAGLIFGPWGGMLYTLLGATAGATIAFILARFLFRTDVRAAFAKHHWYKRLQGKNESYIAYAVFVSRLMPQISFDLVSYLAGLTQLSLSKFILATFLGMLPIVFLLSFFGYLLQPFQNTVLIILFAIFVLYILYWMMKHLLIHDRNKS